MIMKYEGVLICSMVLFTTVKTYPVVGNNLLNKVEFKDEKQYPNGTVVGKYKYKDKDGNPVHVKYYADDSSFGLELKSVTVLNANDDVPHYKSPKVENTMSTSDIFQPLETIVTNNKLLIEEFNKNKTYDPFEILNTYRNKINRYKGTHKANNDYEIFLENDLKPTENYDKEKVKVYIDKSKRKTRYAPYHYKQSEYCQRF